MKLSHLSVRNLLSFGPGSKDEQPITIDLSEFNLFIGPNNSGKSNVLRLVKFVAWIIGKISEVVPDVSGIFSVGASPTDEYQEYPFAHDEFLTPEFSFSMEIDARDQYIFDLIRESMDNQVYRGVIINAIVKRNLTNPTIMFSGKVHISSSDYQIEIEGVKVISPQRELVLDLSVQDMQANSDKVYITPRQTQPQEVLKENQPFFKALAKDFGENLLVQIRSSMHITPETTLQRTKDTSISETLKTLDRLKNGRKKDRERYYKIKDLLRRLLFPWTVESEFELLMPEREEQRILFLEVGEINLPIEYFGSGVSQILAIVTAIVQHGPNRFVLMEEPEISLHPGLIRNLFDFLREMQGDLNNQYFIASHSNVLVDDFLSHDDSVFHLRAEDWDKDGQSVKTENAKAKTPIRQSYCRKIDQEDLPLVAESLGIKPSDVFMANAIVFVEGISDAAFLNRVSPKVCKDWETLGVRLIPTGGDNKMGRHISVWLEAVANTRLPFFVMLDKGSEIHVNRFLEKGVLQKKKNCFIWSKPGIEGFYPLKYLEDCLRDEFEYEMTPEDKRSFNADATDKTKGLCHQLSNQEKHCSVQLIAQWIGDKINPNHIEGEIRNVIGTICAKLTK